MVVAGLAANSEGRAAAATEPFGPNTVLDLARQLSQKPFVPPESVLPRSIGDLSYDDYQSIQFRHELAIGRDMELPIWVELFHRGLLYKDRIDIAVVRDGVANEIPYSTDLFTFGLRAAQPADGDVGFSGLRLIGQLNVTNTTARRSCTWLSRSCTKSKAKIRRVRRDLRREERRGARRAPQEGKRK